MLHYCWFYLSNQVLKLILDLWLLLLQVFWLKARRWVAFLSYCLRLLLHLVSIGTHCPRTELFSIKRLIDLALGQITKLVAERSHAGRWPLGCLRRLRVSLRIKWRAAYFVDTHVIANVNWLVNLSLCLGHFDPRVLKINAVGLDCEHLLLVRISYGGFWFSTALVRQVLILMHRGLKERYGTRSTERLLFISTFWTLLYRPLAGTLIGIKLQRLLWQLLRATFLRRLHVLLDETFGEPRVLDKLSRLVCLCLGQLSTCVLRHVKVEVYWLRFEHSQVVRRRSVSSLGGFSI